MKRTLLLIVALFALAGTAHAGVFDSVKSWIWGNMAEVIMSGAALALSAAAGFVAKKSETNYNKVTQTLTETGEFIKALGDAAADRNITREELAGIIRQGADVVNVFVKTPGQYSTGQGNPEPPRATQI